MNRLLPHSLAVAMSTVSTVSTVLMIALAVPAWAAAPSKARHATTASHKPVAYRTVLPKAVPAAAMPGKSVKPAQASVQTYPDNDGSRFQYDSCGCVGN